MEDIYLTIDKPISNILHKEKASKFYGFAIPVHSVEEIKNALISVVKEHPGASHHCYAYKIALKNKIQYRANDDGEPNGTAGMPIYNQILSHNLTNILLVSVRYFGGTKLGISGLIKAYKTSVKYTLAESHIIEKQIKDIILIKFKYPQLSEVMNRIKKNNATILNQKMEISCEIKISIRKSKTNQITNDLSLLKNVKFEL